MSTKDKHDKPGKEITVIVNGRPRQVEKEELTFAQVVQLAFENAPTNEATAYTVTYKRGGNAQKPEGSLVAGENLKLKKGMIINVSATDKS